MRRDGWGILAVGALVMALGSPARADDPAKGKESKRIEDPARVGRPGEQPERGRPPSGAAARTRELSGKVVKADAKTLHLEHMQAVVPLKIDEKTEFSGEGLRSSRDLTPGQEVRVSFTVEETTNRATRVSLASAPGHAAPGTPGQETRPGRMPPGQPPQVPPERGPGMPPGDVPVPREPGTPVPDPAAPVPKY